MKILLQDIYDLYREFKQDPTDGKFRPNLVVHVDGDDIFCLPITRTQPNNPPRHEDDFWKVEISEYREANLIDPSWVMVNQLKVFNRSAIGEHDYRGPLQPDDWDKVIEKSNEYTQFLQIQRGRISQRRSRSK